MNLRSRKLALAVALAGATLATPALAELEANIGVASNYVWRGLTQTDDAAAVSGGLDYTHASGFYAGTWTSNVDFGDKGYEFDVYAGYAGEAAGFSYDVGYIYYAYPSLDDSNFSELYLTGGYGPISAAINYQVDADFTEENYLYFELAGEFELTPDYGLKVFAGVYDLKADGDDVTHFGATLSKGEFSLSAVKNDVDGDDDPRIFVGWAKTF
ncbi:MAG: TorF family putative porin [Thiotrichales bacterium]